MSATFAWCAIFSIVGPQCPLLAGPTLAALAPGGLDTGHIRTAHRSSVTQASGRQSCNYCLYVPSGLTATDTVPLLVMLHGCRQDGQTLATGTRMNTLADRHRFIVLYPSSRCGQIPFGAGAGLTATRSMEPERLR